MNAPLRSAYETGRAVGFARGLCLGLAVGILAAASSFSAAWIFLHR